MIKKEAARKRVPHRSRRRSVGKLFEAASINAGGDVKANYIMNSNINAKGRVIVAGNKSDSARRQNLCHQGRGHLQSRKPAASQDNFGHRQK